MSEVSYMQKQKSKAENESSSITDLKYLSPEVKLRIAKVLDITLRNFELDSFGYGDMSGRNFYRLLFIPDKNNPDLHQGEAWTVLRGINKHIDGFQFISTGVERDSRSKGWNNLMQQLKNIRKTLGVVEDSKHIDKKIVLYLTPYGDLYKEPKSKYCYPMRKEKIRLELVKSLSHEFRTTEDIQTGVGANSKESVRKAVAKINEKSTLALNLTQNLIESKPYSGYRVNPTYIIEEAAD